MPRPSPGSILEQLEAAFREKPAIHRFPGSMAGRVQELSRTVVSEYGGDAARVWTEAKDADDLRRRIGDLPGFGKMKITALGSVLAKRYGLPQAQELVPSLPTLGDVDSPEALERFQAAKRAYKASMRPPAPVDFGAGSVRVALHREGSGMAATPRPLPPAESQEGRRLPRHGSTRTRRLRAALRRNDADGTMTRRVSRRPSAS